MRTGRPKAPLTLSTEERRESQSLAHRSRSANARAFTCTSRLPSPDFSPVVSD